ncbi:MAG TPA: 4'-phosphopantetheinyl transferase superfamily protein [Vicinamibacterales bacterium]|nr:4'-phosphopantetheinyl transferase superfamily protein [Vicinamibacterales bacterium]
MLFAPIDRIHAPSTIGDRQVHLWLVQVDIASVPRLLPLLSDEERDRARRYFAAMDAARFAVGRATLRLLAAHYLHSAAESLQFHYDQYGKPHLRGTGDRRLHFNVSHSGGLALLAFCTATEVGIDIERVRDVADSEEIIRRVFHAADAEAWTRLPIELRRRSFFEHWTRREAYLKALGTGVASAAVRVSSAQDEEWSFIDATPSDEYAAALAIKGREWHLQSWLFAPGPCC